MNKDQTLFKNTMFNNRPYFRGKDCDHCHKPLTEPFTVMEEKVSIFRGDDEVYAFHKTCPYIPIEKPLTENDSPEMPTDPQLF